MLRSTQLQTVVSTDLVDSTALVEKLGDHRAAEILRQHDEVVRHLIRQYGGREIDRTDGFVILFDRPISAILFALGYHEALSNQDIGQRQSLAARVGIHLGEIEIWENNPEDVERGARPFEVEGLAIAMAARINSIARPRQTLLSPAAYDVAKRSSIGSDSTVPQLYWRSHAYYRFKGVSDPVEIFEVGTQELDRAAAPQQTDKAWKVSRDSRQSLVVLPFANLSPQPETDYISDGLADEIITNLSGLAGLRVIARTSAMQLKDRSDDRGLAAELGVQYALKGSVRKSRDNLRISAGLIRLDTGEHLWAKSFDGAMDSIFEVQETIARSVVDALKIRINVAQAAKLIERPIPDIKAYEYYLRAREQIHKYTAEGLNMALSYLHTGQSILGDNPQIIAAMGYVFWQFRNAGIDSNPQKLREARKYADKLLALDPDSPDGHRLLGLINMHEQGDIQSTIRHLKRSLDVNPNDTDTLLWLPLMYGFAGRISSGYALTERLLLLDPLATLPQILPGFLAMLDGDFERACEGLLKSHELNPGNPITALSYAQVLAMAGRSSEACDVFASMKESVYGSFFASLARFYLHAIKGDHENARKSVTDESTQVAASDLQHSWNLAQCFALIGDNESAISWLENAINFGFWNFPLFDRKDPLLEPIRGDESFKKLMEFVKEKWVYFEV